MTLQELRDEIETDSLGLGYKNSSASGDWKGDGEIAALLNNPALGAVIRRSKVQPAEIRAQIDAVEFIALTAGQQRWLMLALAGSDPVDTTAGSKVRDGLLACFGALTATRAALLAVVERPGSRAEVLWGEGTLVTPGDVGQAFNLIGK